jgi:hypothetical protein
MKKASASFLVLFFSAILVSFNSFAQHHEGRGHGRYRPDRPDYNQESYNPGREILREQVNQNIRSYEKLRLSDLLRLSYQMQRNIEIISLSLTAQSYSYSSAQIELSQFGRLIGTQIVSRQLNTVNFYIPPRTMIDGLELSSGQEVYLSSIVAEVIMNRGEGPYNSGQVQPNSIHTLRVNQSTLGYGSISLVDLVKQQLRLDLRGAEIQGVTVFGETSRYGREASVQLELNRRPVGIPQYFSRMNRQAELSIYSFEEVQDLNLIVNGDAQILDVVIRVGQVRTQRPPIPGPNTPTVQRFQIRHEISPMIPYELSRALGYERRFIRAITIEARSRGQMQAQLSLLTKYGESQGVLFIGPNLVKATLQLRRPMLAEELRLEAFSPILVEALEVVFDSYQRY